MRKCNKYKFSNEISEFDKRLYRGYTKSMKTAISLPEKLYEDAQRTAQAMGIPRSQLFAIALEEYINRHKKEKITEKLNEVYETIGIGNPHSIKEVNLLTMRELTKNDSW